VSFLVRRPVAGAATIAGKALAGLFFLIGKRRGSPRKAFASSRRGPPWLGSQAGLLLENGRYLARRRWERSAAAALLTICWFAEALSRRTRAGQADPP
jgi:hypothetical protein